MRICNVDINCFKKQDLFLIRNSTQIVVTVNAEAIVRSQSNSRLRRIISNNISTIDGQIPLWLGMISSPHIKVEKLSGSDIIYDYCKWAESNNYKVFLLGGSKESNKEATMQLGLKFPNLLLKGYSSPYAAYPFRTEMNHYILLQIEAFKPDILFVGFGMGKQEFWADDNLSRLTDMGVKYVIGCGGTFDFVSGRIKRAPFWVQRIGIEGLWRLIVEPKLFRFRRLLLSFGIFYYFLLYDILKINKKEDSSL